MEESQILAQSMLQMYGEGAERMAAGYAEKHRCAGDGENRAVWLNVVAIIQAQTKLAAQ